MRERTDQELIDAAAGGDADAFETLYYRYRDWAVRLAWRFTANEQDALDVAQQAFMYLLRKLPRLRLTARLTTYLYPVVKHRALDLVRKRRRRETANADLDALPADPPPPGPGAHEDLMTVLGGLPEGQREVLLMRYVDDMTLAEVADALGIPLGTVKSRIHNALRALRRDGRTRRYFEP